MYKRQVYPVVGQAYVVAVEVEHVHHAAHKVVFPFLHRTLGVGDLSLIHISLHQWKQRREYSVMEDRWNTDTERRDMTVWLFDLSLIHI